MRDAKCEPDGRCTPAPLQLPEATSLAEEIVQMRERDPDALVNYTSLVPEQRGCIDTPRMTTLQFSTGGVPYEAGMYDKDFFPGITSVTPEVPALAGYFVTEPLGEVSTTMPDGCANAFIDFQWGVVAAPSEKPPAAAGALRGVVSAATAVGTTAATRARRRLFPICSRFCACSCDPSEGETCSSDFGTSGFFTSLIDALRLESSSSLNCNKRLSMWLVCANFTFFMFLIFSASDVFQNPEERGFSNQAWSPRRNCI